MTPEQVQIVGFETARMFHILAATQSTQLQRVRHGVHDTRGDVVLHCEHILEPPQLDTFRDDLPVTVVEAVARALAKDPAARFASTAEFVRALGVVTGRRRGPFGRRHSKAS